MPTTGQFILERLIAWGVRRIYGYPGDGINGILGGFHEVGDRDRVRRRCATRRSPRFAACAHAKFTGEVGVCMATIGPGAIHLLNGLYDAKLDHQPVVAIVGQQARMSLGARLPAGGRPRRRCSRTSRASSCRRAWCPAQAPHLIDRAMRIAQATRSVDLRDRPERRAGGRRTRSRRASTARCFSVDRLQRAARRAARRRTLRARRRGAQRGRAGRDAGRPGRHAAPRAEVDAGRRAARRRRRQGAQRPRRAARRPAVRDRLDRPARHQAERRHDGGLRHAADGRLELPLLGVAAASRARRAACRSTSTRAPDRHALPDGGQPRRRRRARRCARCCRCSSARRTAAWRERDRGRRRALVARSSTSAGARAAPTRSTRSCVFHELSPRLPDGAILTADSGSRDELVGARTCAMRDGHEAALSGTLATMCPAVPYALAAKFAYPDRPVIACDRRRRDADARHQRADRRRPATATRVDATRGSSCSCSTTTTSTRSRGSSA